MISRSVDAGIVALLLAIVSERAKHHANTSYFTLDKNDKIGSPSPFVYRLCCYSIHQSSIILIWSYASLVLCSPAAPSTAAMVVKRNLASVADWPRCLHVASLQCNHHARFHTFCVCVCVCHKRCSSFQTPKFTTFPYVQAMSLTILC